MKIVKIVFPIVMLVLLAACGPSAADSQAAIDTQVAALINEQAAVDAANGTQPAPTTAVQGDQATIDPLLVIPDDANCTPDNSPRTVGTVTEIQTGDQILVNINGRNFEVRYIGIDSGDLPLEANRGLVEGKQVLLITDTTDVDEYGRLVRYVIADGVFVNLELLRRGAAYLSFEAPDLACEQAFKAAVP